MSDADFHCRAPLPESTPQQPCPSAQMGGADVYLRDRQVQPVKHAIRQGDTNGVVDALDDGSQTPAASKDVEHFTAASGDRQFGVLQRTQHLAARSTGAPVGFYGPGVTPPLFGFVHVVVTKEPSVKGGPTTQGSDGVAAKLLGPGGWLHVVVIQFGAVPGMSAPHDATGVTWVLSGGRVQV